MKKLLFLLTLLCALTALTLTACGGANDTTTPSDTTVTPGVTTVGTTTEDVLATAFDEPEKHVTLPELSTIKVSDKTVSEQVDDYIKQVLASLGRVDYQPVEAGVAAINGDSLNIHYTGRAKDADTVLSEETLAGMTNADDEAGYDLVLGSGAFIPGFEEQLIGAKAGDTVNVDVTFPDGYSEELSNLPVIFEVTINSVSRATISNKHLVVATVVYTLNGDEANEDIAKFLAEHEVEIDLRDMTSTFDELFAVSTVSEALLGKNVFGTATASLTLPADAAAKYGYDHALSLNATFTIDQIVYYPEELTDAEVSTFTGGEYTDVASFRQYVYNHYKASEAYSVVYDTAEYAEIPEKVYTYLYNSYYDNWMYQNYGDISDMTEEELAAILTDSVKKEVDEYATTNATAEYQDRMLMAYLSVKLNFTLSEERYTELLNETYNYYVENYYLQLLYSGIADVEDFEAYFGADNLRFQFTSDEVITLLGTVVSVGE